ncbi:MAG: hypothetical protein ABSF62_11365 [Bryobacteraceae bacterium]
MAERDPRSAARIVGDFIKSPSFFIRSFRFVQDYQKIKQTRFTGEAKMAVWLHSVDGQPATAGSGACGSESVTGRVLGH